MLNFTVGSHHKITRVKADHYQSEQGPKSHLTFTIDDGLGDVEIFIGGPLSLDKMLDLGYEIVNQCNEIKKAQRLAAALNDGIDFGESLEANIGTLNEHAERISERDDEQTVRERVMERLEREAEQTI